MAYHHKGFWKPMDTLREKNELSEMAFSGSAPWLDDLENNLNNK
jgi:glucose-1-phosphate cytidylyltransferase